MACESTSAPLLWCCPSAPAQECLVWQSFICGSDIGDGVTDEQIENALSSASWTDPRWRFNSYDSEPYPLRLFQPLLHPSVPDEHSGVRGRNIDINGNGSGQFDGEVDGWPIVNRRIGFPYCPNVTNGIGTVNYRATLNLGVRYTRRCMTRTRVRVRGSFCLFDAGMIFNPFIGAGWFGTRLNCRRVNVGNQVTWYEIPRPSLIMPPTGEAGGGSITFVDETCSCEANIPFINPPGGT